MSRRERASGVVVSPMDHTRIAPRAIDAPW
jgi:hypothetical protein